MDGKRFLNDVTAGLTVLFAAISSGAVFGAKSGRRAFDGMMWQETKLITGLKKKYEIIQFIARR